MPKNEDKQITLMMMMLTMVFKEMGNPINSTTDFEASIKYLGQLFAVVPEERKNLMDGPIIGGLANWLATRLDPKKQTHVYSTLQKPQYMVEIKRLVAEAGAHLNQIFFSNGWLA